MAYKGFVVPEGIPFPKNTSCTKPLFVAAISTGASSFQPVLREGEVEEKEEEEEEEVVELSDSSDDFGIFDQPIRSEEDLDEMGIQRKPQRSLMELIENQPGKNVPGKPTQSQILSLPTRSPPPTPHQPLQPVRADAAELKRRRELKGKDVVDAESPVRPRRRMPSELQNSRKLAILLNKARRGLTFNLLSHKHGCQHPCTVGSPYEMMHLLRTSTVALGVT